MMYSKEEIFRLIFSKKTNYTLNKEKYSKEFFR